MIQPTRFDDKIIKAQICPYCLEPPQLVDSSIIYGKSYGMVYYCDPCKAWVGCHKKPKKGKYNVPLGRLANHQLREAKKRAHFYFDQLWKKKMEVDGVNQYEARNGAYKWLALRLGIERKYCHIGYFDVGLCMKVVSECRPYVPI